VKVALITGCSSGFGEAFVRALLGAGWTVVATARRADQRNLFEAESKAHPESLAVLPLDVTSEAERAAVRQAVEQRFGRLDLLVNNAGYALFGALEDQSPEQLRDEFEVNFFGTAFLTRDLLPLLRASKGRVVNVSSVFGYMAFPMASAYCASKFAVKGLTESLRHELAPHGVQVSLLEPGGHRTRFGANIAWAKRFDDPASPYHRQSQGYFAFRQKLGAGKGTGTEGVTRALLRLASAGRMPPRVRVGSDARWVYRAMKWLPEWLGNLLVGRFARRVQAMPPSLGAG